MSTLYPVKIISLADVVNWSLSDPASSKWVGGFGKETFGPRWSRFTTDGKLYYSFITFYCTQTHFLSKSSDHLTNFMFTPDHWYSKCYVPVAYQGGFGVFKPPKFKRPSKIVSNLILLWKLLKIGELRTPKPQDVRKKGCKILNLPCFAIVLN